MDFKFKTTFSSIVKSIVSEEKDKYLALASLADVSNFIPQIDTERNIDLLPVAFNACVINRANKNGDVIDTATALDIYKHFANKPIDVEHNRQHVIGVILAAGFSEFGTDKPLSEEQIKDLQTPFNMTLGGVLWKIVNPELTDKIEESNDASSDLYQKISASWELGFSEYDIAVADGDSKNLEDCSIINDKESIASLDNYLKANGGTGRTREGKSIYRKVVGRVVPLGIGLTENPAADVKGVAVNTDNPSTDITIKDAESKEVSEKISQSANLDVNIDSKKIMKINSAADINDTNWKELSASVVTEFLATEIKKLNEDFVNKKSEQENLVKDAQASQKKMEDEHAGLKAAMEKMHAELTKLQEDKANREKMDTFNARMGDMHATYALTDDMAKTIAEQLKSCSSEEDYGKYKSGMAAFLKPFERKKEAEAKTGSEEKQNQGPTEQTPEVNMKKKEDEKPYETKASAEKVVDRALDNAKKETISLPNSIETKKPTLLEKYSVAFSLEEGFIVNKNRR
jgi:hypothetical protein